MKSAKKYVHLNHTKRDRIQALLESGHKQKEVARILEVDKSTISREKKRNRKKMNKKIKGVIFDFNGVLWWDNELQERAWKEFAAKLRGPLSNEEMLVHMHGRPNAYVLGYLIGHEVSGEELLRLTEEKEAVYRNLCLEQGANFKLSPGATDLLDFLSKHNIPFTIATSSEITNLLFYFKHLPLDKWFDIKKVAYDDNTFPGKPAPDIYLRAAKDLGLAPRDCLVIEDARSGIKSAHAANIGLIAALGPKEKHNALRKLQGVDLVIENVGELLEESAIRKFRIAQKEGNRKVTRK